MVSPHKRYVLYIMNNGSRIRQNFTIFQRVPRSGQKELIYLDNAATAHKPDQVINTLTQFYSTSYATVHRALYELGEIATTNYEQARDKVAQFINAQHSNEVIFTKGTTEGINLIAAAWAVNTLKPGDEIVLTQAEHHSNLLPWQWVAQKTGARLVFIPINTTTYLVENLKNYLNANTKLVAVTLSSNVLGPIWNKQSGELEAFIVHAKSFGAHVLVDAAQAVAHQSVDVQALGADFLVFSGHKMFGPTGIGVLYISKKLHNAVQPYQLGGSMVYEASFTSAQWAKSPQKFEAGTPPIADAIGLGAAIDYINQNIDFAALEQYEASLCSMLIDGLEQIDGVTIVGNVEKLRKEGHLVSIALDRIHPHDVATHLGSRGIAVRAGHFCAQPLVTHLGFESLLRISIAAYNNVRDIEIFLQELRTCIGLLKSALY